METEFCSLSMNKKSGVTIISEVPNNYLGRLQCISIFKGNPFKWIWLFSTKKIIFEKSDLVTLELLLQKNVGKKLVKTLFINEIAYQKILIYHKNDLFNNSMYHWHHDNLFFTYFKPFKIFLTLLHGFVFVLDFFEKSKMCRILSQTYILDRKHTFFNVYFSTFNDWNILHKYWNILHETLI